MNRDADVENEFVNTVGEGKCEMNLECSTDIYTLPDVKLIDGNSCIA